MLKLYLLGFYLHTGNVIYKKSKGRVWIFAVHRPALYSLLGVREPIQTHRSLAMTTLMWIDAWVRLRIFVLLCWDHKHQEHDVSVTSFCVLWWFPAICPWLLTCFLGKWIRQQRCMSVHCGAPWRSPEAEVIPTILWQMSSTPCAQTLLISQVGFVTKSNYPQPKTCICTNTFTTPLSHTLGNSKRYHKCMAVYQDMNHNYDCCWTRQLKLWANMCITKSSRVSSYFVLSEFD